MEKTKVLFISANPTTMSLVPPVVSLFYSILKANNIEMKYFDTQAYDTSDQFTDPSQFIRDNLLIKEEKKDKRIENITIKKGIDLLPDFRREVQEWKPDLIMGSATESTFLFAIEMFQSVREFNIPHVLGGVFATFASDIAISFDEVDIICTGEGENIIVPLCQNLKAKKDIEDIPNLWIKKEDGSIAKTQLIPPVNLNDNPPFDASIYDDDRFYRGMAGKIYRIFPVETHRGCPHRCTFCNSPLQERLYREQTGSTYFRKKSIKNVIRDICYLKEDFQAEYFHFWADNFFAYSHKEIEEFCHEYTGLNIPFYIQAYPTNITERKLKSLVEVGLDRIGIGVEHGNEEFREKIINRKYSNKKAIECVELLKKYNVQFSCNNIVGFPKETPELHMDTVELNRILQPHTASASIFTPFHGTPLRDLAIQCGYLKNPNAIAPTNSEESILDMPQFSKEQISGKARTFNLYIKLPKSYWKDIKKAESVSPEGDKIWIDLKEEYAKYE